MNGKIKNTDRNIINYPDSAKFTNIDLKKYPTFKSSWDYSHEKLCEINKKLNDIFGEDPNFSVLVAGSYGRMDANCNSDLDFFIIHNGHLEKPAEAINKVREVIKKFNINLPNPEGAFSTPIALSEMLEIMGSKKDTLLDTAQRMLILMEGRPIYNATYFDSIISQLLDYYLKLVKDEPSKEVLVLLNDLIRYFRAICLNVEFSFWQDKSKWGLRNIKLRHSRLLIYAGLLFLILNSSKKGEHKITYLKHHVSLSPIEKIFAVYQDNGDYNFEKVLGAYNNFLYKLNDDAIRKSLSELDYADRYKCPEYAVLTINSQFLQTEFSRFILENRGRWSSKIFEYLIF